MTYMNGYRKEDANTSLMGIIKHNIQLQKSRTQRALTKNKNKHGHDLQWTGRRTRKGRTPEIRQG
jgi:hypothetical protein